MSEKESGKAAAAAESSGGGEEPKRAKRATSNVFALFNQSQIQEFKEVWMCFPVCYMSAICLLDMETWQDVRFQHVAFLRNSSIVQISAWIYQTWDF